MTQRRRAKESDAEASDTSRRAQEMKARRTAILDAAEISFGKNGYHDTSMADIARAAEFGVGYLYRHFTDKGDLYLAVIERKSEALLNTARAAIAHEAPAKFALATFARVYLSFFETNRAFFKFITDGASACPPELQKEHHARVFLKILSIHREVSAVISRGIARGELRDLPADTVASAFIGMLHGLIGRWFFTGADAPLHPEAETAISVFLQGTAA